MGRRTAHRIGRSVNVGSAKDGTIQRGSVGAIWILVQYVVVGVTSYIPQKLDDE